MTKGKQIMAIRGHLAANLGGKLAGRMGKSRLLDIAEQIADYKEQVGWENTPQELRRLRDRIRYIPAHVGLTLDAIRLSRKSESEVYAALWKTLRAVFPSLDIHPT